MSTIAATKTIWCSLIEQNEASNLVYTPPNHTTLNQARAIEAGTALPTGTTMHMQYLVIGKGGHANVAGSTSRVNTLQHGIKDADLFDMIPFVLRETTNDLSAIERAKYRLRKLVNIGGTNYFAYYVRVVTLGVSAPVIETIDMSVDPEVIAPYVVDPNQLAPTPLTLDVSGNVNNATSDHIRVATPLEVTLDANDLSNILDAVTIITGDPRDAVISEVGMCYGMDKNITSSAGGVTVTYDEVLACTIAHHIPARVDLQLTSDELQMKYKLSTTQPLLT